MQFICYKYWPVDKTRLIVYPSLFIIFTLYWYYVIEGNYIPISDKYETSSVEQGLKAYHAKNSKETGGCSLS